MKGLKVGSVVAYSIYWFEYSFDIGILQRQLRTYQMLQSISQFGCLTHVGIGAHVQADVEVNAH